MICVSASASTKQNPSNIWHWRWQRRHIGARLKGKAKCQQINIEFVVLVSIIWAGWNRLVRCAWLCASITAGAMLPPHCLAAAPTGAALWSRAVIVSDRIVAAPCQLIHVSMKTGENADWNMKRAWVWRLLLHLCVTCLRWTVKRLSAERGPPPTRVIIYFSVFFPVFDPRCNKIWHMKSIKISICVEKWSCRKHGRRISLDWCRQIAWVKEGLRQHRLL